MKRVGYKYQKIIEVENLRLGAYNAMKGKDSRRSLKEIKRFKDNEEELLLKLHNELKNHTYTLTPYTTFKTYKPKERSLKSSSFYPDQIIDHAVMNIMEPIWRSILITDTYATIKGRGLHKATNKIKNIIRSNQLQTKFYLQLDIEKCYQNIDHKILINILKRKIKDWELIKLFENILKLDEGLPIGRYLSQYFANLYFAYFDHFAKEVLKIKYYFRYMDDIVILGGCKKQLWSWFRQMKSYLNQELKAKIKGNYRVAPLRTGLDYLGFVHYPTHTLLRKRIKKGMVKAYRSGKTQSIASYKGWADHADTINLIRKLELTYPRWNTKRFIDFQNTPNLAIEKSLKATALV